MTVLEQLVHTPLATAAGLTLVHSLWEGAVAALFVAAVSMFFRSPRVRYACACAAMAGVLGGFVFTFYQLAPDGSGSGARIPHAVPPRAMIAYKSTGNAPVPFPFEEELPWLAPFWMAGVLVFHLRSVAGWMAAQRLRERGVCRAPDAWAQRLEQLRARLGVTKAVVLLETGLADVPVVIGYLAPVIMVPTGMLAGMPGVQVEAILLHELAHIKRHDYLANLLQRVAEGFLFYHPAIWWISGVIRAERENCCDDLAVEASGSAREYAAALTALEETRWTAAENQAVLAATGGNLMKRIRRLLCQPEGFALAPFVSAGVLTIIVAGALAAWQATTPAQKQAGGSAEQPKVSKYTEWLTEDVVYIIDSRERAAFLSLKTDAERDEFIEQFWERRNPEPGLAGARPRGNAFKTEHYRRISYVNDHYRLATIPGWKSDRGRIYIQYGPPDEIESHPSGWRADANHPTATDVPTEQWMYRHLEGIGDRVIVEFRDAEKNGNYRMTMDPNPSGGKMVKRP